MELNIEKFSPTTADLRQLVAQTSQITASDLKDKVQLKRVKENRIQLRDARVAIEKTGKALRADALAFQKAVIAKEKELVAIVEPEELRLKSIEEEAEHLEEMERRQANLPVRKEMLASAGLEASDEEILALDDEQFLSWRNQKVEEKNEAERQRLEAERRAIEEEKAKIERAKELEAAAEKAREEERKRQEAEKLAAEAKAAREKEEAEKKEAADKQRLEAEKKYQAFRAEHGWTEETKADFKEERIAGTVVLWKKVGVFEINDKAA